MTQEQKELLLKDLCTRLPYGVKVSCLDDFNHDWYNLELIDIKDNEVYISTCEPYYSNRYSNIESIKPYLFPLSSMTEEQYEEWCDLEADPLDEILTRNANGKKISTLEHHLLIAKSLSDSVNYCYKNHFDIYGLIPMGLAIDATGLGIY